MTLSDFIHTYTGHYVGPLIAGYHQCVALVELYAQEVYGDHANPPFSGNAIDIFGERAPAINPAYKWVRNNPADLSQVPPVGAIMVWGADPSIGVGPLGHVDIIVDAGPLSFDGFDQNWPVGAAPHAVRHTYDGVIGWGYPANWDAKPAPAPAPTPIPVPGPVPVPLTQFWAFQGDSDLHPPNGVMSFNDAYRLARTWVTEHPGVSLNLVTVING